MQMAQMGSQPSVTAAQVPGRPQMTAHPGTSAAPVQPFQPPRPPRPHTTLASPPFGQPLPGQPQWQQQQQHIWPPIQIQAENQLSFNQNITMSNEAGGASASNAPTTMQQQAIHDTIVMNDMASDPSIAQQQPANVEITNSNMEVTNINAIQVTAAPEQTCYDNNGTFFSNTLCANSTYADTSVNVDYATTVDVNVAMNVDVEVDQSYITDRNSYSTCEVDIVSEESVTEWSTVTTDYSGGDWGDGW
jgi:hypothetical protein